MTDSDRLQKTTVLSRDLYSFVWKESRSRQLVICLLTMLLAPLMMVPLEIQRRIVDDAVPTGNLNGLFWLCGAYLVVVLLQGTVKYLLNMAKGVTVEEIARDIRLSVVDSNRHPAHDLPSSKTLAPGAVVSILAAETEDVSGFGGEAFGLPLLTGATILYVVGYLLWVEPMIAAFAVALYLPQALIVRMTQHSINRLARLRIINVRNLGRIVSGKADRQVTGKTLIDRIFALRISIYLRKYALAALGNFLDALGPIVVLCVGGYLVMRGETQVGTLVVFISGLNKIADPWDQLINFYRSVSNTAVAYDMIRSAMNEKRLRS